MKRRTAGEKRANKGAASAPGRLRIVAGIWRSRVLEVADVPGLRPTSERIRETLFNWLTPRIARSRCLDLYAGTGALGLEALSRGAKSAVFVEKSRRAARALDASVTALQAENVAIHCMDAVDFLVAFSGEQFDVVFLDPPFANDNIADLCRLLAKNNVLAEDARVYIEQDRQREEPTLPDGWQIAKMKSAGNVRYALLTT